MPRLADKTLGEACANGDGTYNGKRLVQWLFEATTGKPMSDAEAEDLFERAKMAAEARRRVR